MARSSNDKGPDAPVTPEDLGAGMSDDHVGALREESEKTGGKINEAYEKLASKLRSKADKAKVRMEKKKGEKKRALLKRRFELYGDAAHEIEMRLADRRGSDFPDGD